MKQQSKAVALWCFRYSRTRQRDISKNTPYALTMSVVTVAAGTAKKPLSGVAFAQSLGDEAVVLVRSWLDRAAVLHRRPDASSERLAGVLKDAQGPAFALGFVDRVARPEDLSVAARNFRRRSGDVPAC